MEVDANMLKGVLDPIVLKLVSERAMYGYEIIKLVHARTQGEFEWKEGTLYPSLHRMEAAGLLSSQWREEPNGRRRKYYAITRKGAAMLREKTAHWAAFSSTVNAILLSLPA